MKVNIRYFASVREAIGKSAEVHETSVATLSQVRDELIALSPRHAAALERGKAVRMAFNQVMNDGSALLTDGCEAAFFPPVTGG